MSGVDAASVTAGVAAFRSRLRAKGSAEERTALLVRKAEAAGLAAARAWGESTAAAAWGLFAEVRRGGMGGGGARCGEGPRGAAWLIPLPMVAAGPQ